MEASFETCYFRHFFYFVNKKEIQEIIDKNPELQGMMHDLRKAKIKGSWDTARKGDKVIHLEDFMKPR